MTISKIILEILFLMFTIILNRNLMYYIKVGISTIILEILCKSNPYVFFYVKSDSYVFCYFKSILMFSFILNRILMYYIVEVMKK